MPWLGLQTEYAEAVRSRFNWAAGLTWFLTLGICLVLIYAGVGLFFVGLPGWFIAVGLYVGLSKLYQRKAVAVGPMRPTALVK